MEPDHLTRRDVCRILKCDKNKFYSLLGGEDPLPAYKLGDGPKAPWRVVPSELAAWIERRKRRSRKEPMGEVTRKKAAGRPPVQRDRSTPFVMNVPEPRKLKSGM